MEQKADICVRRAPTRGLNTDSHKRRAACSPTLKHRLAQRIQAAMGATPTEQIRRIVGDAEGGSGGLRRDVGHIRACRISRSEQIGFERLLVFCEAFGIDPADAMQPAGRRLQ